jgi:hypothetical protein
MGNDAIDELKNHGIEVILIETGILETGGWVTIDNHTATIEVDGVQHIIKYKIQSNKDPLNTDQNYDNKLIIEDFGDIESEEVKETLNDYLGQATTQKK